MPAHPAYRKPRPHLRPVEAEPARPHLIPVPPLAEPDAGDGIPAPSARYLGALAAQAFEAVSGRRAIAQLGGSITVGVARDLARMRTVLAEREQLYRDVRHIVPRPGRVRLFRPREDVAEVAVVLHTGMRARAVAMRLEWAHGRWRACSIGLL